jgi:acetyltransferase-like isoleucine patch superfamily enzyme
MTARPKDGKVFDFFKRRAKKLARFRFRLPRFLAGLLFKERLLRKYIWLYIKCKIYYENLLRYRCRHVGENLMLFGGFMLEGNGNVYIGDNVTMFDKVTFFTGGHIFEEPEIRIGNNCNISYGVIFRCAKQIIVGDNCRIAGGTIISDNDSHPIDVELRRADQKVAPEDVKPVIIEDDVWIGDRCIIMKGVTIGKGSIVSAGSVVLQSVEPMRIVMGVPARTVLWVPGADTKKGQTTTSEPQK